MNTNFEANKAKIVNQLKKKAPNLKCPICANTNLTLGGGFFAHDLQEDLSQRQIGGINIPTIPIVCSQCGYIMEFAAGTLELLPQKTSEKQVEQGVQIENKNEK